MRNRICSPSGRFSFSFAIASWTATAHSTAMGGNQPIEDRPVRLKPPQCAELIQPHQAAVLGNVGRKDRGKLSFDYLAFCHRPSSRALMPEPNSFDTINIAFIPPLFDGSSQNNR